MYTYWIKKNLQYGWQYKSYDKRPADQEGYEIEEVQTEGPLIRIWTVANNLGDGDVSSKLFATKEKADKWAEGNEYYPEVHSEVIDVSKFQKVIAE